MSRYTTEQQELLEHGLYGRGPEGTPPGEPEPGLMDGGLSPPNRSQFILPHYQTFAQIVNQVSRTYRFTYDEARRHSDQNALAVRRDPVVFDAIRTRQLPTVQLTWHLQARNPQNPAESEGVQVLTDIIENIPRFQALKLHLLESIYFGRYGVQTKMGWDFSSGRKVMTILDHKPIHGEKLVFKWGGQVGIRVNARFASDWEVTDLGRAHFLSPAEREQLIVHRFETEDTDYLEGELAGGIHGKGLRDRIYWFWWLKNQVLTWMMDYLERVGAGGFTIYYYEHGNPASLAEVQQAAQTQMTNNVILFPRYKDSSTGGPGIQRVEPGQAGAQLLGQLIGQYFDQTIRQTILGQEITSKQSGLSIGSGGADLDFAAFNRIVKYDALSLADTLTTDLVKVLAKYNTPGIPCPRFVFDVDRPNAKEVLEAAKIIWEMGGALAAKELYSVAGLAIPEPDEPTLVQQPPQPAGQERQSNPDDQGQEPQYLFRRKERPVRLAAHPGDPRPLPTTVHPFRLTVFHQGQPVAYDLVYAPNHTQAVKKGDYIHRTLVRDVVHPRNLDWNQVHFRVDRWGYKPETPQVSHTDSTNVDQTPQPNETPTRLDLSRPNKYGAVLGREISPAVLVRAKTYLNAHNLPSHGLENIPYLPVDQNFSTRVAQTYDQARHDPHNPAVSRAYRQFVHETGNQFRFLQNNGVRFEGWRRNGQPYQNSAEMAQDARQGHMFVFTGGDLPPDHPLAGYSGYTDDRGHRWSHNDVFRAVHDYFGHALYGNQFGPRGEEHAYRVHSRMYSPLARRAMAWETRGQNSWVNFGPHGEQNRANPAQTVYADQKANIMPLDLMGDTVHKFRKVGDRQRLQGQTPDPYPGRRSPAKSPFRGISVRRSKSPPPLPAPHVPPDDPTRFLSDEEMARLGPAGHRKFLQVKSSGPKVGDYVAMAKAGRALRDWYDNSSYAIHTLFPDPKEAWRFTQLLSATSVKLRVAQNFLKALDIWHTWDKFGRPQEPQKIYDLLYNLHHGFLGDHTPEPHKIRLVGADKGLFGSKDQIVQQTDTPLKGVHLHNVIAALSQSDSENPEAVSHSLSGPKVSSFAPNLYGDNRFLTADVHHSRFAGKKQELFSNLPHYLTEVANGREAAHALNNDPTEPIRDWDARKVQAAIWGPSLLLSLKLGEGKGRNWNRDPRQLLREVSHGDVEDLRDLAKLATTHELAQPRLRAMGKAGAVQQIKDYLDSKPKLSTEQRHKSVIEGVGHDFGPIARRIVERAKEDIQKEPDIREEGNLRGGVIPRSHRADVQDRPELAPNVAGRGRSPNLHQFLPTIPVKSVLSRRFGPSRPHRPVQSVSNFGDRLVRLARGFGVSIRNGLITPEGEYIHLDLSQDHSVELERLSNLPAFEAMSKGWARVVTSRKVPYIEAHSKHLGRLESWVHNNTDPHTFPHVVLLGTKPNGQEIERHIERDVPSGQ